MGDQQTRRAHVEADPSQLYRGTRTFMVQAPRDLQGLLQTFQARCVGHRVSDIHTLGVGDIVRAKILELKKIFLRGHMLRLGS